jgi:sugar lactone lactonase YvrE
VLVCDAARGLLALDPATGRVETLATEARGQRMLLVDNAAVHSSGDVYFSDSSRVHRLDRYERDIAEDTSTGRLLRLTTSGDVEVLVERLRFANGVALAADESFVAVAESGGRRVVRRWLTGPQTGQTDVLADDLPGYPDNLSLGTDGLLWVALASPPIPALERLARMPPPVRRLAGRAPRRLRPRAGRSARVLALDATGHVVHDLDLPSQDFHFVTGVREHEGRVWLGSLREPAIAWCEP